jgi:hypothetical protein
VLALMNETISRAAYTVIAKLKAMLQKRIKEGDIVVVVGVGNTVGIK